MSATDCTTPEGVIFSNCENPSPGKSRSRVLGSPPKPTVTYMPPRPWNEMCCGPAAGPAKAGFSSDGSPDTTRSCVPCQYREIAPVSP